MDTRRHLVLGAQFLKFWRKFLQYIERFFMATKNKKAGFIICFIWTVRWTQVVLVLRACNISNPRRGCVLHIWPSQEMEWIRLASGSHMWEKKKKKEFLFLSNINLCKLAFIRECINVYSASVSSHMSILRFKVLSIQKGLTYLGEEILLW